MALSDAANLRPAAAPSAAGGEPSRTPGGDGVPQAPEEALETQLRAILDATQMGAGAVCLFDQHKELLRLAVEVGLSDEGCRRLRNIRRGSATAWDMPLHSLLNRRAYLIESAAKNRYVPPLVDNVAAVRAVACIPLHDAQIPVGSLILVALAPKTFGERQVRLLEQPARDLVRTIVEMRKRVMQASPEASSRPSLSSRSTLQQQAAAPPAVPGASGSPVQAVVDRTRTELDRLRARIGEAEESAARERARGTELEGQLREAQQRSSELQADLERLHESFVERTAEHQALGEQVARLEQELAAARDEEGRLRAELERATAAQTAQATSAEATAALEARAAELEAQNGALRVELEGRPAAPSDADVETRVAAAVEEATRRSAAAVAEVEARAAAAATEADGRHAAALADAEARLGTADRERATWQERCEEAERRLADAEAAAASHVDQVAALARDREHSGAELDASRQQVLALQARVAELQGQLDSMRREDDQLRHGFAHLESLIQVGVDGGELAAEGRVDDGFEVIELDGSSAPVGAPEIEEFDLDAGGPASAAPAPVSAPVMSSREPVEGVVVLDAEATWADAVPAEPPVRVVAPDGDVVAAVAAANPERLLVNLAAPGSLAALATARAAGITTPALACIVVPGQPRGFALGRFEVASRPIDPDALLGLLEGEFVRGTRVVTAGADVDGLISVRQALARLGVSVSMAWDRKQVGDLLSMVRPDVAIIDLELPPKDGCAVVARLALSQPVPTTVVVPKPDDTARSFAEAIVHPELGRATIPTREVLAAILARPLKTRAK